MLGAAVLPLTGASVGQDPNDGPLLMACARLKALCSKPLPDADADADEAIMARHELFQDEICSRPAMTAAGVRAPVLAWLQRYGPTSDRHVAPDSEVGPV